MQRMVPCGLAPWRLNCGKASASLHLSHNSTASTTTRIRNPRVHTVLGLLLHFFAPHCCTFYLTNTNPRKLRVYVLVNYWSSHAEDMWRIETLVQLGFDPYVMIYDKHRFVDARGRWLPGVKSLHGVEALWSFKLCQHLQRWCNHKAIFRSVSFETYLKGKARL